MGMKTAYDVAVVGAGVAGVAYATILSQGISATLVMTGVPSGIL